MKKLLAFVIFACSVVFGAEETYKSLDGTIEIKADFIWKPKKILEIIHNGTPLLKDKVVEFGGFFKECVLCHKARFFISNPANKKARCELFIIKREPVGINLPLYEGYEPKVKYITLSTYKCETLKELQNITQDEQGNERKFFIIDKEQGK